ncbi:MAG: polymer-forming cytoskeletal protein [Geobacter sp.]|nr:polymer-forming cytoskeletal protein [Geobacter sp.]
MFGRKEPDMEVIIGPQSGVKGEITSKGTVRVDGRFEGNVAAECFIIGESGAVTGDIIVKSCIIGGKLIGNIRASGCVEIRHSGEICGDIYATRISMAEGAKFDGRSYMQRPRELELREIEA